MAVFDPTQGFNAFAQGAQIGGGIRKSQTQRGLAPMLANNDYEGAMKYVAGRGDLEMMDYVRPMQEKAAAEAYNKQLGGMLASGDTKGAIGSAFAAGKLDQGVQLYNYDRAMKADEITDYKSGIDYLASNAERLKEIPDMAMRGQEAMRIIQESPFGQDQNVVAAVQRAAADGKITDEEIDAFNAQLLSAGERLAQQNTITERTRQDEQLAAEDAWRRERAGVSDSQWSADFEQRKAASAATAASAGKFGVTPIYGRREDGTRVLLQTSNAGGVMQVEVPEGVTLEDDYSKTFARETAKEDAKKAAYETQAGMAVQAAEESFTRLSAQIDDAISKSTDMNTGFLGQFLAAGDLDGLLETIGAVTAFDSLVALKAQGGTLGALSDTELNLLRSKVANLARSQSQEQLDANLEILRLAMQGSMQRIKAGYEAAYASGEYGTTRPAAPSGPAPPAGNGLPPLPPGLVLIP